MSATIDLVHLNPLAGRGLQVENSPRDLNYPPTTDVRTGTVYSYDNSLTGELDPAGTPPAVPSVSVTDLTGGDLTFTISAADLNTTNHIYTCPFASSIWSEKAVIPENGTSAVINLPTGGYWCYAVSISSSGNKNFSQPISFFLAENSAEIYSEIRYELRSRILAAPGLSAILARPDGVYLEDSSIPAIIPAIVICDEEEVEDNKTPGKTFFFNFTIYSKNTANIDSLSRLMQQALVGASFDTTNWSVRGITKVKTNTHSQKLNNKQYRVCEISLKVHAYEKLSIVTFQTATKTLTLPAPAPLIPLEENMQQARAESIAGNVFVYDRGISHSLLSLKFILNATEYAALLDFFQDKTDGAGGMMHSFTYTDALSNAQVLRFAEPAIKGIESASGVYEMNIIMERNV